MPIQDKPPLVEPTRLLTSTKLGSRDDGSLYIKRFNAHEEVAECLTGTSAMDIGDWRSMKEEYSNNKRLDHSLFPLQSNNHPVVRILLTQRVRRIHQSMTSLAMVRICSISFIHWFIYMKLIIGNFMLNQHPVVFYCFLIVFEVR